LISQWGKKKNLKFMASLHNSLEILRARHRKQLPVQGSSEMNRVWRIQIKQSPEATKITLTSETKKAWNPYGTLCGNSTTATGLADIVFASITFTDDFLHIKDGK
jgi:hypothetical protein